MRAIKLGTSVEEHLLSGRSIVGEILDWFAQPELRALTGWSVFEHDAELMVGGDGHQGRIARIARGGRVQLEVVGEQRLVVARDCLVPQIVVPADRELDALFTRAQWANAIIEGIGARAARLSVVAPSPMIAIFRPDPDTVGLVDDPELAAFVAPERLMMEVDPETQVPAYKHFMGRVEIAAAVVIDMPEGLTPRQADIELVRRLTGAPLGEAAQAVGLNDGDLNAAIRTCTERGRAKAAPGEVLFTVGDVFEVKGRGPCISRPNEISKAAWDRGERWQAGDEAICVETGERAIIAGVERFAVHEDHPSHFDGSLLLKPIDDGPLNPAAGQTWRKVQPAVTPEGEPPA